MTKWRKLGIGETVDPTRDGPGTETVGKYLETEEHVGQFDSSVHKFEDADGKEFQVWGNTVLDARFARVKPGQEVKIVYLGQSPSKEKGRSAFKNFDVFVADGEDDGTEESAGEKSEEKDDLPF